MSDLAIVVDIQALQNPLHRDRGIGRYIVEHVDALIASGAPLHALVLNPGAERPALPARWIEAGLVHWNRPEVLRAARDLSERVVYHVPSAFEPAIPEDGVVVPHALRGADVLSVMVHDAIPLRFPEWYQRTDESRRFFRRRAALVRRADVVVTNSKHSGADAVELFHVRPERVVVQGTGAASFLTAARSSPAPLPPGVRAPYVMTVTGWGDPRKDATTAFAAYARLDPQLRATHQLVVTCGLPPDGLRAWTEAVRALGLTDREVVFTGHVDDDTLRTLYERAGVFVFSSRYEGFGLPALEAAVCGAPVITTDTSSLPEVLDLPASLVPVGDPQALAAAIERAVGEPQFRADLLAAGARAATRHTWSAVAERTLAAWRAAPAVRLPPLSTRVALTGPFPPSKSGVAIFNERVAGELATRVQLDCFRESDDLFPPAPVGERARWHAWPVQALGRTVHPGSFDAVIHTLGNGHAHRHTLRAALAHRGIVWLHDARLAGLYLTAAGLFLPGPEPGPAEIESARATMHAAIARVYGPDAPHPGDHEWWRTEWYDAHGLTFLEEVLDNADAVIVNTQAAQVAVTSRAPELSVHVLAHPFPDLGIDGPPPRDDEPLVITLGWVDPVKRPDDLIRSIARVARSQPCRLAFVGEVAPSLHAELCATADAAGVSERVEFTGFTDAASYASWLSRAALVVQLRTSTHGEASGALCDAIGAGRPVLTSIGTADDLPDGVVARVAPDAGIDDLAAMIASLLAEPHRRDELARSASSHASSWRYSDLAGAVADIAHEHATRSTALLPG